MALSDAQISVLLLCGLLALVAFGLAWFALDLRAAYRSADANEHAAAASTIGQMLVVGLALSGGATILAVWYGAVLPAVLAAALFWLVTVAAARFHRSAARRAYHPADQ